MRLKPQEFSLFLPRSLTDSLSAFNHEINSKRTNCKKYASISCDTGLSLSFRRHQHTQEIQTDNFEAKNIPFVWVWVGAHANGHYIPISITTSMTFFSEIRKANAEKRSKYTQTLAHTHTNATSQSTWETAKDIVIHNPIHKWIQKKNSWHCNTNIIDLLHGKYLKFN